jgi:hypothetical protein
MRACILFQGSIIADDIKERGKLQFFYGSRHGFAGSRGLAENPGHKAGLLSMVTVTVCK